MTSAHIVPGTPDICSYTFLVLTNPDSIIHVRYSSRSEIQAKMRSRLESAIKATTESVFGKIQQNLRESLDMSLSTAHLPGWNCNNYCIIMVGPVSETKLVGLHCLHLLYYIFRAISIICSKLLVSWRSR